MTDVAHNPSSDASWFELVCGSPRDDSSTHNGWDDVNTVQIPRTFLWSTIHSVARSVSRLGLSRSEVVMDLAHHTGSTPLSCAAQRGNLKAVRWLLQHGAGDSTLQKNRVGCTPLDVSRIFGPHREVSQSAPPPLARNATYSSLLQPPLLRQVEGEIASVVLFR